MSKLLSSFSEFQNPKATKKYYIVKDDFVVNLMKERQSKRLKTHQKEQMQTQVTTSTLMVKKKAELFQRMQYKSKNTFYELDRQIEQNRANLYRKLNVALRRSRVECKVKIDNPFVGAKSKTASCQQNNHEKKLSKLIYSIQPHWIKQSVIKVNRISK